MRRSSELEPATVGQGVERRAAGTTANLSHDIMLARLRPVCESCTGRGPTRHGRPVIPDNPTDLVEILAGGKSEAQEEEVVADDTATGR